MDNPSARPDIPRLRRETHGAAFEAHGHPWLVWGVEDDQWHSVAGDREMIDRYIEASRYINANCLAVHLPWALIEPEPDRYDFSTVAYYLQQVEKAGLKAVVYFTSANYAAGAMWFTPAYVREDDETYTKIQGDERWFRKTPWLGNPSLPVCPSNPRLLAREAEAYRRLMAFIRDNDPNRNVLAVQVGGETNFFMALQDEWMETKNEEIHCQCPWCSAAWQGFAGTGLQFMTRQFSNHIKAVVQAGAAEYDLPVYTCAAPFEYGGGSWRYAEDLPYHKANLGRDNYFVGPSIAETNSVESFTREMDHYTPDKIPGNVAWTSGIDTGHGTPGSPQEVSPVVSWPHLEMAPWFIIFHYGGPGAIYWDHPDVSVTKPGKGAPVREKFRAFWAPLRALSPVMDAARGTPGFAWWHYGCESLACELAGCTLEMRQPGGNYGFAFPDGDGAVVLAATTYMGGATAFTLRRPGGWKGVSIQRGAYGPDGRWAPAQAVAAAVDGDCLALRVAGDHGEAARALYRITFS